MREIRHRWLGIWGLRLALGIGIGAAAVPASAQNPANAGAAATPDKPLAEICAVATCRMEPHELRLRAQGGSLVTTTDLLPYVHDGTVVLYPGEAVTVDFAADGSMVDMPHFAGLLNAPDATGSLSGDRAPVTLNFSQMEDKPDMLLVLKSSLGFAVKYDAYMYVPTPNGVDSGYTSSCPLRPGLSGTEHWPHAIMMIVLTNFRVAGAGDSDCQ